MTWPEIAFGGLESVYMIHGGCTRYAAVIKNHLQFHISHCCRVCSRARKHCSIHSIAWGHLRGKLGSMLSSITMITVSSKAFLAMWEPLSVGSVIVRAARATAPEQ